MNRRTRWLMALALAAGLSLVLIVWHNGEEQEQASPLSLSPLPQTSQPLVVVPPQVPTPNSPLPSPSSPVVNAATLEAVRLAHPTGTPLTSPKIKWPYISPTTWRRWAFWCFTAAALLGYLGLRLRRN